MEKTLCQICQLKSLAERRLSEGETCILEENRAEVSFNPGDIIIRQNALSTNVAYVKSGLVKIHVKGPFREKIMKIAKAPTYLCLPSSFGDKINHFSVTAIEPTVVCFIDLTVFKKFIYENGDFAYQIILNMSKSELQNFHNFVNNAQKLNPGRIADAILFFAHQIYASNQFTLPISRQELADLTGITRESASRILTEFHSERILDINGRQIEILNEKLLSEISEKG